MAKPSSKQVEHRCASGSPSLSRPESNVYETTLDEVSHYDVLQESFRRKTSARTDPQINPSAYSAYLRPVSDEEKEKTESDAHEKETGISTGTTMAVNRSKRKLKTKTHKYAHMIFGGVIGMILGCLLTSVVWLSVDKFSEKTIVCLVKIDGNNDKVSSPTTSFISSTQPTPSSTSTVPLVNTSGPSTSASSQSTLKVSTTTNDQSMNATTTES